MLSGVGIARLPYRFAPLIDKENGEEAGRMMAGGSSMLGRWSVRGGLLGVVSCVISDEMMRNGTTRRMRLVASDVQ